MTQEYDRLSDDQKAQENDDNMKEESPEQLENSKLIEGEKVQIEQIINRIIGNVVSVKYLALLLFGICPYITSSLLVSIPVYAGKISYTKWECVSEKCLTLLSNHTDHNLTESDFYTRKVLCSNSLQRNVDFKWTATKTSYGEEWDLICENESKGRNLMSFFFIGAFLGVITGTMLFDNLGRRIVTLVLLVLVASATLANGLINSYKAMLVLRVVQGFCSFIVLSGIQLMAVEFTPTGLRNIATIILSCYWGFGSLISLGVCYGIQQWRHMILVKAGIMYATFIPLFLAPESPRFHLVKGRQKEAKETFKRLAILFNNPIDIDALQLDFKEYQGNFFGQLKDFLKYPAMLKNTVLIFFCYLLLSACSYARLYGWNSMGVNVYLSVVITTCIGLSATFTGYKYFLVECLGRRKALAFNFAVMSLLLLLALINVKMPEGWNWTQVMLIISTPFLSSCWTACFLFTSELAPTSHRGMIVCLNSAAARIGAFLAPYVTLLYNTMEVHHVSGLLAIGPALAAVLALICPDTSRKPIPSTPEEVGKLSELTEKE